MSFRNTALIVILSAFIGLFAGAIFNQATAATPEAVATVQEAERGLLLNTLFSQIVTNAQSEPVTNDEAAQVVALAKATQEAIDAKDYAKADALLADLLDLAVKLSQPRQRA